VALTLRCTFLQIEETATTSTDSSSDSSVVYEGDIKLLHYYLGSDRMYCLQGGLQGAPLALKTVQVVQRFDNMPHVLLCSLVNCTSYFASLRLVV
jgi:hypothetical protein